MRKLTIFLTLAALAAASSGCDCGSGSQADCSMNSDCDPGYYCDSAGNCVQDCREDRDCPPGQTCDVGRGQCWSPGAVCTGDANCEPGFYCDGSGRCRQDCRSDGDCAPGQFCDVTRGRCHDQAGDADPQCETDQDCGAPHAVCQDGTCIMGCGTVGCPAGQVCNEATGRCEPKDDRIPCSQDSACDPPNTICVLGFCSPGCAETGCPSGLGCDGVSGHCRIDGDSEPEELTIAFVDPPCGPASGGNPVRITGAGFTAAVQVSFGEQTAGILSRRLPGEIRVSAPEGAVGPTDVTVTDTGDGSTATRPGGYCYVTPIAAADFMFLERRSVVGQSGGALVAGDISSDGAVDLVAGNPGQRTITVLLNQGDGTFPNPIEQEMHYIYPSALLLADLDGDDDLDLISANGSSANYLTVAIGDGIGNFAWSTELVTGIGPVDAAAADLNRDGRIDQASANRRENNLTLLAGGANGGFLERQSAHGPVTPLAIAAFADEGKSRLAAVGDGNRMLVIDDPATPLAEIELPDEPGDLIAGDFDQDGLTDLLVSLPIRDSVLLLQGLGNRLWAPQGEFVAGPGAEYLAAGDIDGDGAQDVVAVGDTVSLLAGDGEGGLARVLALDGPLSAAPPVVADLDGDHRLDIAVRDGLELIVYLNRSEEGTASDAPVLTAVAPGHGPSAGGAALNLFGSSFPNGMEVTVGGAPATEVTIMINGWARAVTPAGTPGRADVAARAPSGQDQASLPGAYLYTDDVVIDPLTFRATGVELTGGVSRLVAADLDGDGLDDLVAGRLRNPAAVPLLAGGMLPGTAVDLPGEVRGLACGDLDGDGTADLVASYFSAGKVPALVLANDGSGSFSEMFSYPGSAGGLGVRPLVADLDGNGHRDLIGASGNAVVTLLGDGSGFFGAAQQNSVAHLIRDARIGYFGFDGYPDVALADRDLDGTAGRLIVASGYGNGEVGSEIGVELNSPPQWIALARLPDAEAPTPFVTTEDGVYAILGNLFVGQQPVVKKIAELGDADAIAAADLNNDGYPDVALADSETPQILVLLGDESSDWATQVAVPLTDAPTGELVVADLDGNGKLDLAYGQAGGVTRLVSQ